jgi:SAM-dependent methyltransferase
MDLKCPRCGARVLFHAGQAYACPACAATYPIVDGVPRFVPAQLYAESFGYQWNRFARTQLDSANGTRRSLQTFVEKTGWSLEELAGKRVLDAGCGMGRFAEVCADAGAEVHGVDLSGAVNAAVRNLGHRANVQIYQADIMNLPFPAETFDFVYSIGVLHHTPDTRAAFLELVPLLKPGGEIAIWVYSTKLKLLIGSGVLRRITPHLPRSWLLAAARMAIPLYHVHRLPVVGRLTSVVLPTSLHPEPEWRWLDTFDWYTPRFQGKHSYAEVERWFLDAGLSTIRRGPFPVSVRGIRPALPAAPGSGLGQ